MYSIYCYHILYVLYNMNPSDVCITVISFPVFIEGAGQSSVRIEFLLEID